MKLIYLELEAQFQLTRQQKALAKVNSRFHLELTQKQPALIPQFQVQHHLFSVQIHQAWHSIQKHRDRVKAQRIPTTKVVSSV